MCIPEVWSLTRNYTRCLYAAFWLFYGFETFSFVNKMLPAAAVFYFPWEINSGVVQDGASVRTFGRLVSYQPEESRATLSAQHALKEHNVVIRTMFVEPFNPIIGAQYLVLGEIEHTEEVGVLVKVRVLNCIDGINVALLQKAINVQRSFFRERECSQGDVTQAGDVT